MFLTEVREVLSEEIIGVMCDICKTEAEGDEVPSGWYVLQRGCEDPECDCGGMEFFHACSPKCYFKLLGKCSDDDDVSTQNLIEFVLPLYKEK